MNSAPIRFDGRVAIVTGAGGGMGRGYAISLASRGARVVVNDFGGDMFGAGGSESAAQVVASEIRAAGGEAIADATPVGGASEARSLVDRAIRTYGRFDILINNAGISAPGAIDAPSDAAVEAVLRTNLIGVLHLMRAAWPTMQSQVYGRILNIASSAALGKGGSAAYAASKSGLIGLTLDAAREGAASGVLVNALMPTAYSRMIEAVPDRAFVAWMKTSLPPEKVAPAALYLVSEQCVVTGRVYSAGGGRMARLASVQGQGFLNASITPEVVRDNFEKADSLVGASVVASQQDEIGLYIAAFPNAAGAPVHAVASEAYVANPASPGKAGA